MNLTEMNKKPNDKKLLKGDDNKFIKEKTFICNCGKIYLSLNNLHIHIMSKHYKNTITNSRIWDRTEIIYKMIGDKNIDNTKLFLESFNYFKDLLPNSNYSKSYNLLNFPKITWEKKNITLKLFNSIQKYKLIMDNEKKVNICEIKKFNYIYYSNSCIDVLSYFLIFISKEISQKLYKELVLIIICLIEVANKNGSKYCELINLECQNNKIFCENNEAEVLPDLFNDLIQYYFNIIFKNSKIKIDFNPDYFLGDMGIIKLIYFIKNLGYWLNIFKFTSAKTEINEELDV